MLSLLARRAAGSHSGLARALPAAVSRGMSTASKKGGFESETVRNSSTLAPKVNDGFAIPATVQDTALDTRTADEYYDHAHLINPRDKTKRTNTYMILGAPKFIMGSMARSVVTSIVYSMSASADVLALGSVEVELDSIPEGSVATIKWRGKPVFIRNRSDHQVKMAVDDDNSELRDPETDAARVKDPKWMVVLGVCTHLGCVPVADAGDYHGWFCPCHGSHYDLSGRIRKGPAPSNLEVPPYTFTDDGKLVLG